MVFNPNHPMPLAIACLASGICLYFLSLEMISPLAMIGCVGIIFGIYLWHNYCYRIEIDDKGIEGPGRYGTMVRLQIPWDRSSIEIRTGKRGPSFLIIKHRDNQRAIKIAENKFSERTLEELKGLLSRHTPAER